MQHTNNRITHYETSTQTATQLNSQQTDKRQPLVGRLFNCLVATTRTTHIRRVYTLHKGPTDTENGRSRRYRADVAIRQHSICGGLYSGSGRAIIVFGVGRLLTETTRNPEKLLPPLLPPPLLQMSATTSAHSIRPVSAALCRHAALTSRDPR